MENATEISFKGGLNTAADFLSMPPGQCLTFSDVQLDYGILKGRNPFRQISTGSIGSDQFSNFFCWQTVADGPFVYAMAAHGGAGKVYRSSVAFQTAQLLAPISYSDVTGTFTPGNLGVSSDVLNDILVVVACDGGSAASKFASNTVNAAALGGSPPSSPIAVKAVNNYMFMAVINSSTFYWSNPSDPETWPAANNISFNTSDGDVISALGGIGTDLIVFKGSSIGILSTISNGTTLGPFKTLFKGLGCLGPNALDNLDDGTLAFWATDGDVYITDGYTFQNIGNPAPPQANIFPTLVGGFVGRPATLRYYPRRHEIWVFNQFMSVTTAYAYDLRQKYWRAVSGLSSSGIGVLRVTRPVSGSVQPSFMLGSTTSTAILCLDDYLNTSSNILDGTGATVTGVAEATIRIPENLSESRIYGLSVFYNPGSGARATIKIGYDTTYSSTTYTLSNSSGTKNRWDFNNLAFSNPNNQRPASIQIKYSTTYSLDKLYAVYAFPTLGA